jgi:NAD(P)-dependent dehydrogenase (short-subunit alcohol dehydrogenase family)
LSARPNAIVFAGVRDIKAAQSGRLGSIARSNLHLLKITSADEADNRAAAAEVEKIAGKVDVVLANAGR